MILKMVILYTRVDDPDTENYSTPGDLHGNGWEKIGS